MATYKVIQDIEAEDKLIGWMSPRQTIYAAIVVVSGFIGFLFTTHGVWWLTLILLPHMVLFSVLAGPFVHDQPSEIWLLAKIQFFLRPRRRIWDQSGVKELVSITVPKKIERKLTDGLSQTEVKSRLSALASTIDSRGWAVKNINVNLFAQPDYATAGSDRLIDSSSLPQEVPSYDITAQDDILDEQSNPTALHLQQMINKSSQAHRQQLMANMQEPSAPQQATSQPADYWFLNATAGQQAPVQPGYANSNQPAPIAYNPGPSTDDQQALLEKLHTEQEGADLSKSHLRTIRPLSEQNKEPTSKKQEATPAEKPQAPAVDPMVQQFASNNDLNVSTIARQANKAKPKPGDDEVIISLR